MSDETKKCDACAEVSGDTIILCDRCRNESTAGVRAVALDEAIGRLWYDLKASLPAGEPQRILNRVTDELRATIAVHGPASGGVNFGYSESELASYRQTEALMRANSPALLREARDEAKAEAEKLRARVAELEREWNSAVEREAGNFEEVKVLRARVAQLTHALQGIAAEDALLKANPEAFAIHAVRRMQESARAALATPPPPGRCHLEAFCKYEEGHKEPCWPEIPEASQAGARKQDDYCKHGNKTTQMCWECQ